MTPAAPLNAIFHCFRALLAALLAGKALKKTFWTAFGMYWALRASGIPLSG